MKAKKSNLLSIGTLNNTHGLKGELSVLTDNSLLDQKFKKNQKITYLENEIEKTLTIQSWRAIGKKIVLKFKEFDNINDVLFLKNKEIFVERENIKLEEGEVILSDLIGFSVFDSDEKMLGKIVDFWNNGSYTNIDIFINKNDKIKNIPLLEEFVSKIDSSNKKVLLKIKEEFFEE